MNTLTSDGHGDVDWELSAALALLLWPKEIKLALEVVRGFTQTDREGYRLNWPWSGPSHSKLYDTQIAPRLGLPNTRGGLIELMDAVEEMINAHDQEEAASRAA